MKSYKTPLRYPGGKSRACKKMDPYFPDLRDYKEYREPFIGGGSVAIHVTKKYPHLKVWVNDLHPPLATFWQQVQSNGYQIEKKLQELKSRYPDQSSAKGLFLSSKNYLDDDDNSDPLWTAISFYIVNKCSFSGLTQSSSFSNQASDSNFSMKGILKLSGYQQLIHNWTITNHSYDRILDESSDRSGTFIYLDPPYDIKDNLYGKKGGMHKGFDHDKFAEDCNNSSTDMMVSYNSDQLVTDRFTDSKWRASEFDLTYTMRSVGDYMSDQKKRKELLLMNYGSRRITVQNGETLEGVLRSARLPGC